jgi:hypothetical protein
MSGGWIAAVDTERMVGGRRLTELYAAWDSDPSRALALVMLRAGVVDQKVTTLYHVTDGVFACLGVPEGGVCLVQAVLP